MKYFVDFLSYSGVWAQSTWHPRRCYCILHVCQSWGKLSRSSLCMIPHPSYSNKLQQQINMCLEISTRFPSQHPQRTSTTWLSNNILELQTTRHTQYFQTLWTSVLTRVLHLFTLFSTHLPSESIFGALLAPDVIVPGQWSFWNARPSERKGPNKSWVSLDSEPLKLQLSHQQSDRFVRYIYSVNGWLVVQVGEWIARQIPKWY